MFVRWKFGTEAEGASDLVGDVEIESTSGDVIVGEATYLDSWCSALLDGLQRIMKGSERVEIDLIEEPEPLVFERAGNGIRLGHLGHTVEESTLKGAAVAIEDAAVRLLAHARALRGHADNQLLAEIDDRRREIRGMAQGAR